MWVCMHFMDSHPGDASMMQILGSGGEGIGEPGGTQWLKLLRARVLGVK